MKYYSGLAVVLAEDTATIRAKSNPPRTSYSSS